VAFQPTLTWWAFLTLGRKLGWTFFRVTLYPASLALAAFAG
jgi:hypothetical protein